LTRIPDQIEVTVAWRMQTGPRGDCRQGPGSLNERTGKACSTHPPDVITMYDHRRCADRESKDREDR